MKKTMLIALNFLLVLSSSISAGININNKSFEDGLSIGWSSDNPAIAISMPGEAHSGQHSVLISHENWQQSVLVSDPLQLQIGHLYQLSAWVRTQDAVSDENKRYPTAVAACLSMASFPFTNHSPTAGASGDWRQLQVQFIATEKTDRVRLHFGYNGNAKGKVWFDDVQVEKIEDISSYIPPETVTWVDEGYRYDDRGWIFVHIEGEPYQRGYQYGHLVAKEMVEYMHKLAIETNEPNPEKGWEQLRFTADAFMLRKYEQEFLTEMKGIADGAVKAGVKLFEREIDLIDVVTMNSVIDIEWATYAMARTANPLSGQSFLKAEDELNIPDRLHKCSSFLANKSSTTDGRIVFGQIFMWGGYTGPHWNVICDVDPASGFRLVYQTFPGGIHSGADFYINEKGIMIGETTVSQTPFNPDGSPQSNRIRKAAQYGSSIDDVVRILTTNNNGMYANDWLIGDTKTDEIAVLLLGTYKHKLWRSTKKEFYGETTDFYWCNNNNKDPEVRKEYIPNADNAPYDLIFSPWNRDIAFNQFYREKKGSIDAIAGVNLWASAPINRPHACDGKITTSAMAENLVFFAHSGKVTLRSKFVGENNRIPDLPGATPRLSLGYAVASPVFITEKLKAARDRNKIEPEEEKDEKDFAEIIEKYKFNKRNLWFNTVYPASAAENWFISGTAAYWSMLKKIPEKDTELLDYFRDELADLSTRYLYTIRREGTLAPVNATRIYDRYNNYQVPRIKGTFLLHQLRLLMGNEKFSTLMTNVHEQYREKELSRNAFMRLAEKTMAQNIDPFIIQWLERDDLPAPAVKAVIDSSDGKWNINLEVSQPDNPYHFLTTVMIRTGEKTVYKLITVQKLQETFSFSTDSKPLELSFNGLNDVPLENERYFTWANFFDDFHHTMIVYGTKRQIEANHTMALRFSTVLADRYTEILMPVIKDAEISMEQLKNNDLIVLGNVADNNLMAELVRHYGLNIKKNNFSWQGHEGHASEQGLFLALPNPYNSNRSVYLFSGNSALSLYNMTKEMKRMPSWAVYAGDEITEKGFHTNSVYTILFE